MTIKVMRYIYIYVVIKISSNHKQKQDQNSWFACLVFTSNKSLSASMSTASCSSPKELIHAVPPQEAVLTLKEIVLNASPILISNLISPLSGVAFARNTSYSHNFIYKLQCCLYILILKLCGTKLVFVM